MVRGRLTFVIAVELEELGKQGEDEGERNLVQNSQ
jgi:hypothetical protein